MKLILGIAVIFICLFLGEILTLYIPFPLPANILGMILLFLALTAKIVKINYVNKAGELLLDNLILFFVPVAVGIIRYKELIKDEFISVIIIGVVGFLLLFLFAGKTVDFLVHNKGSENNGRYNK